MKKIVICMLYSVSVVVCLSSCNVTRTITTESRYIQRGDTSVVITTKTIETYDATKQF